MNGQTVQTNASDTCVGNSPQNGFISQILTQSAWNSQGNKVDMWLVGPDHSYVNVCSTGCWGFDGTHTIASLTRTANWDWVSGTEICYDKSGGMGGTTDQGCSGVTVPNSFYLSSKPAFFGSYQWPWVDPTTGTTYTLPAKYCFQTGNNGSHMPACLQ